MQTESVREKEVDMKVDSDEHRAVSSMHPDRSSTEREEEHVVLILKVVVVFILVLGGVVMVSYMIQVPPPNPPPPPPKCEWSPIQVMNSTSVRICFGRVTAEPRPTMIDILLTRNGTVDGLYRFVSDDDGNLAFISGTPLGSLTYNDLANNEKINIGDVLELTGLTSNSSYDLIVVWNPTGDQICSMDFMTPS